MLVLNKHNWKIKAKNGYESFVGILDQGKKRLIEITFSDDSSIKVTENHRLFFVDGTEVMAKDISLGDEIQSEGSFKKVSFIDLSDIEERAFDIFESESNTYFGNMILNHNCEFLSEDQTLIDSFVINQIETELDNAYADNDGETPIEFSIGDVQFFKKINTSLAYIVGVDVSSGNGNDYSVITVLEFPTMDQVLEFRSNKLSEKFIYSRLKNILLFLQQNALEVYFSVENNGLGASVLALYEYDTNPPSKAMLISDEGNNRLGLSMSETTKRRSAIKFKNLIENRTYKVRSKHLVREMKSYTRQGATYKAEAGATDDCIASNLIVIRVLEEMAEFNPYAYDKIYSAEGHDGQQEAFDSEFVDNPDNIDDMPMPFTFG